MPAYYQPQVHFSSFDQLNPSANATPHPNVSSTLIPIFILITAWRMCDHAPTPTYVPHSTFPHISKRVAIVQRRHVLTLPRC